MTSIILLLAAGVFAQEVRPLAPMMAAPAGLPASPADAAVLGAGVLSPDASVQARAEAAIELGRLRNWRAAAFLRHSIKDPAREVRFASAVSLGKTGAKEAVPLLIETLERDSDWWVRFAAASGLGDCRTPAAVAALAAAAAGDAEYQVRMQAIRSLGRQGSREAARALAKPLADADAGVRAASAMALGEIGGVDSLQLLASALHKEADDFPRGAMTDAIKRLLVQR